MTLREDSRIYYLCSGTNNEDKSSVKGRSLGIYMLTKDILIFLMHDDASK